MNSQKFLYGLRDGVPIGIGYLTVSFSIGIAFQAAGLSPAQGFWFSILNNTSSGEYAGVTAIVSAATILEVIAVTLVVNARYLLMSCALSQKLAPSVPLRQRLLIGFDVTDELFGIAIAQAGYLNPYYYFGAMCSTIPFWSLGAVLGIILGNLMPAYLVSGFSVTLFGMFLAVIIPAGKKDKVVLACIVVCFICSYLAEKLPLISTMSDGSRTIILTITISAIAALLFPKKEEKNS